MVCPPDGIGLAKYYTEMAYGSCMRQASFFENKNILSLGFGYAVVLGLGLFFAVFTAALVWLEERYIGTVASSECLQSANVAWKFGQTAHLVFLFFCFMTNCIVTSMLLLGGSSVVNALTGMNIYLACFLIPLGVIFYTLSGGLKATFLASYTHSIFSKAHGTPPCSSSGKIPNPTISISRTDSNTPEELDTRCLQSSAASCPCAALPRGPTEVQDSVLDANGRPCAPRYCSPRGADDVYTVYTSCVHIIVYTTDSDLGSPKAVYNALKAVASKDRVCTGIPDGHKCGPVAGNYKGSYLTMLSNGGLVSWPGLPRPATAGSKPAQHDEQDAGPSLAQQVGRRSGRNQAGAGFADGEGQVEGQGGQAQGGRQGEGHTKPDKTAQLHEMKGGERSGGGKGEPSVMCGGEPVRAVTSSGSAELIAVSSLMTYDIYRTYINPKATGKQILACSRYCVLGFGMFMGVLAIALSKAGVSLGWMYEAMGCFIGSAVIPVALLLLWKKANAIGAIAGSLIGMVAGVITWLVVAQVHNGTLDLYTTGKDGPMLSGNLVAILSSGIIHIGCSLVWPEDFDFEATKAITMVENDALNLPEEEFAPERLSHAKWWIIKWGCCFTFVMLVLWPLATLPAREFNLGYFTFWVTIVLGWGTIASVVIIVLPVYESWGGISIVLSGLFTSDIMYKKIEALDAKIDAILRSNPEYEKAYTHVKAKEMSPPPKD
ncbi:Urea transporter [Klebsormidium nitens]|uniref:Urea transporter n=1 Tax=Klebsormidium nitens TaxID=105231 RepID=A0A1Y1HVH9_KLENI|nr:Urea transporter [Klebsormidium nitens]|eukprot:GAQ82640.1 Urea transporter [Klebsormidium nitens]